jgi:hypothetical protein
VFSVCGKDILCVKFGCEGSRDYRKVIINRISVISSRELCFKGRRVRSGFKSSELALSSRIKY